MPVMMAGSSVSGSALVDDGDVGGRLAAEAATKIKGKSQRRGKKSKRAREKNPPGAFRNGHLRYLTGAGVSRWRRNWSAV
jgi:hypothetical protein